MKYKSIAVIYGGDSSEWEISCKSGEFVASNIDSSKYDVYEIFARLGTWQLVSYNENNNGRILLEESKIEVDKNDFSIVLNGKKVKFDFAYIMQHGTPGENGLLQAYFEMLNVPFSTSSSFVSAMNFDKQTCKFYIYPLDYVKCAKDAFIRKGQDINEDEIIEKLGLPIFVKPTIGGSSFGITKVKTKEELIPAIDFAYTESDTILLESEIIGRELTDAVFYDGKENVALPVIEIITENDYFDYEAKYQGKSQEVCPANIPIELKEEIQQVSKKLYSHLDCAGLVRFDYIYSNDGLYFLEVNNIPGMTSASLVPQMVRAAKIEMKDFLSSIIENS